VIKSLRAERSIVASPATVLADRRRRQPVRRHRRQVRDFISATIAIITPGKHEAIVDFTTCPKCCPLASYFEHTPLSRRLCLAIMRRHDFIHEAAEDCLNISQHR